MDASQVLIGSLTSAVGILSGVVGFLYTELKKERTARLADAAIVAKKAEEREEKITNMASSWSQTATLMYKKIAAAQKKAKV